MGGARDVGVAKTMAGTRAMQGLWLGLCGLD